jgi:hypothetical protein
MRHDELRQKNAFLREKIKQISERHPELRDLSDEIALEQSSHVEVGTPFLERVNGKLQEAGASHHRAPSGPGTLFRKLKAEDLPPRRPQAIGRLI